MRPVLCHCNGKDGTDGSGLHDWAKSLQEIHSSLLMIALSYQAAFASFNIAIRESLYPKNSTTTNKVRTFKGWNKGPSVCLEESLKFKMHGLMPFF